MLGYLYGKRFVSSQTFYRTNTPTFSTTVILHTYPPIKMEQTQCSKTFTYKIGSSQTFSRTNTSTFSNTVILHTYPPVKMEQTECSETLAYKIHTLGNYPEESIQLQDVLLNKILYQQNLDLREVLRISAVLKVFGSP
jgi:hypothetical protein